MNILIIGATGYVGSAIARAFAARSHNVSGLARNAANRDLLVSAGVTPVQGDLANLAGLSELVRPFDVVIMAAMVQMEAEVPIMQALIDGCRDGHKHVLFTSGSGVISTWSKDGSWSQYSFAEDDAFPFPARYARSHRLQTEAMVRGAAGDAISTYVISPPLIYGHGGSIQIPQIFESVRKTGSACYLGYGLNLYSAVHVDDLAEIYCLAVERGTPGALYHAVSGEANYRSLAEAVAHVAGCDTKSLDYEAACALWGAFYVDAALAANSRPVARRTVADLGWAPRHLDVIEDIRTGSYRTKYEEDGPREFAWASHG